MRRVLAVGFWDISFCILGTFFRTKDFVLASMKKTRCFFARVLVDVDLLSDLPHQLFVERLGFAFVAKVEYKKLNNNMWPEKYRDLREGVSAPHDGILAPHDGISAPHDLVTNEHSRASTSKLDDKTSDSLEGMSSLVEDSKLLHNEQGYPKKVSSNKETNHVNHVSPKGIRFSHPLGLVLNNSFQNLMVLHEHINDESIAPDNVNRMDAFLLWNLHKMLILLPLRIFLRMI
ncbi:hypothetical protein VNO80_25789 [Phaseolus coccineus]|uniref:Uncharacterized protein n=1 Tax=Phaseolus coccineus TaxID=3886 RepID=A0AAN9M054_PHACN